MKFRSTFFAKAKDLLTEKDRLWDVDDIRRRREEMVRAFYNCKELATRDEGIRDDTGGLTNHGIGYRNLQRLVEGVFAIYSTTNHLIQVKVETGNVETDTLVGERISKAINEAIYASGRFESFWSSVAGELVLTGRAPSTFGRYGWCPSLASNLLLPENSSGVAEEITYGFASHELNMAKLKGLKTAAENSKKFFDLSAINLLIDVLEKQIKGEGIAQDTSYRSAGSLSNPLADPVLEESRTTIKAWKYYEVSYNEEKKRHEVSSTLFTQPINLDKGKSGDDNGNVLVLSFMPVAYEDPTHWLHPMIVDSQIGGLKTFSAARGPAELTYASDSDSEELMNELMEGEKIRARPKFAMGKEANRQQVSEWNVYRDSIVPHDVSSVQVYGGGNNLGQVLALLNQNSSSLTGGTFSNVGRDSGELRQQALERQSRNASMENNRMSAVYTCLDRLAREIVRRFMVLESKPGTEGYDDIMWFREEMERQGLKAKDLKDLGKIKHGRFCYVKVRVARSIGSGDRDSELAVADQLMTNIANFDPQVRPLILRKWTTLMTRDPDLSETLAILPPVIINGQKIDAEGEFPTILRRAALGQTLPISPEDIGEDHVPVHMLDLQAFLAEANYRPFDELDLRGYAGAVDHITAHLQTMASVPASAGAAKVLQAQMQQLTAAAQPIIQQAMDRQQQAQGLGMSPVEEAKLILQARKQTLDEHKEGRATQEMVLNEKQRREREARADRQQHLNNRKQYVQEGDGEFKKKTEVAKLRLQKEKIDNDKSKAAAAAKKKSKDAG